ncbi:mitochondrial inner membrane protease subunit 1 [Zootermopsis nevadensis]|uniref:Mitochondrial inner membrane protease subunit n=1 Tax=Zootermopsis nevadensis TaxID=136037 RepID=A0A067R3V1_ZOONE|nr:mitochondrial inner membrane protease subunit 1 [Zootermopsis nevadensis]KDR13846.1 Mitochondrial inner membrane protease subunit 1 [Zootermopsis nevadensis]
MSYIPNISNYATKLAGVLAYMVQYGCITHCVLEYVGDFVICTGPSMEPTIYSNDILLTEHITPRFQRIKKGDIIIAKSPSNPQIHVCKRVTGMPGDKVLVGFSSKVVPRGHVWLEGDNRSNSADSRIYGPVPQGLICARALCRVWPPKEIKMLTHKKGQVIVR